MQPPRRSWATTAAIGSAARAVSRWLYDRHDVQECRRDLAAWLAKWSTKYPKLCDWVEANIEELSRSIGYPWSVTST